MENQKKRKPRSAQSNRSGQKNRSSQNNRGRQQKPSSQNNRKEDRRFTVVSVVAVVLAVVVIATVVMTIQKRKQAEEEIRPGVEYLESLESKDPSAVDNVRKAIYQAKVEAQREEMLRQLHSGEVDPFSMFQDYALLGDSRAVGYDVFGFLEENRVLAGAGNTIRNIEDNMESVVALNPSTIYLCYGLNDISIGFWSTAEEYAEEYMQIVADIREQLPDATIVISSTLPAQDPAFQKSSKWYNIPEWNDVLQAACEENDVIFVDNSQIAEEYADLWDVDGIHVKSTFYPHWATELITATLMGGVSDEE